MRTFVMTVGLVILLVIVVPFVSLYVGTSLGVGLSGRKMLDRPLMVRVYLVDQQRTIRLWLGEYLVGVVAAEMPADFHLEALKAQAVAARTYVYRRMRQYGGPGCKKHPNADVCNDPTCCQAYLSPEQLRQRWGELEARLYMNKISQAVRETYGEIATYRGVPIDPVFHSTCGGKTENSESVWGSAVPYLRSVPCSYDRHSPKWRATRIITKSEIASKLSCLQGGVPVAAIQANLNAIAVTARTATGRVAAVKIGNIEYSGTDFRYALGLNSTSFSWEDQGDCLLFTTIGYGHGVGMCQYGADGMAAQGYDYRQILRHYYQGIDISPIPEI